MGRDTVVFKGTRNGLVIVLDPNREYEEIRNTLLKKMEAAKGFFKGAKFSFFNGQQAIPENQKSELENICRQFGMVPNSEAEQAFLKTGFSKKSSRQAVNAPKAVPTSGEAAYLVKRSLRSGQRVQYPGHVVVLGDVHPGAEVVSGGSVMVMGSCRGVVHAGAGGDRSAKVIALKLAPTVISIADRRFAPELDKQAPGPRLARLSGQEIVFEEYQTVR
ncbi:MAG TPA: septum site-determining protein MinC [Bacillota bacterium]|jgi:septum site-determining protein MinC|nr:septum site-determining protein MinC [Peptococcaceae bacterium MAG4]NLW38273.1 septum site-determining protein MinC [Peptococcaceae bacterium]HPZ42409.1 septum site-determining protein MinC [Bacillota bacterium]HQD75075.1 septum site-determining protein MinC [Bacillota bacterium]HUM57632.1 septum site-determining protein MinC [Bacillota bacterium]